jgi:hypothetical protein
MEEKVSGLTNSQSIKQLYLFSWIHCACVVGDTCTGGDGFLRLAKLVCQRLLPSASSAGTSPRRLARMAAEALARHVANPKHGM